MTDTTNGLGLRVLGVITARSGSKGIPGKNTRPLCGRPLIAYTIEAARDSSLLTDCIVSTDDAGIAEVAREAGAEVPFLRPPELAGDEISTLPVLVHALQEIEWQRGTTYDYVLTLQPTSPFRTAEDIDAVIRIARSSRPSCVVSVKRVTDGDPRKTKRIVDGRLVDYFPDHPEVFGQPRQAIEQTFRRNAALYLTRRDTLLGGSIYGPDVVPYEMPEERSLDINTPLDFAFAEFLLRS